MNKKMQSAVGLLVGCLWLVSASALDESGRRYIDRLAKGGPESLHEVAETLVETNTTDPEVLDVAAEVLLEKYKLTAGSYGTADAMSWLCKALGNSGSARYKDVLKEVSDHAQNRKVRGYCSKAAKSIPRKSEAPQYVAGSVNLERLRQAPIAARSAPSAQRQSARSGGGRVVDFNLIKEGMSSEEVSDLLGPPTATNTHMTGKQFVPFNYGARDLQRMNFLYKGVGHIEFSLRSAYNGVYRVIAIVPDPNETGYP